MLVLPTLQFGSNQSQWGWKCLFICCWIAPTHPGHTAAHILDKRFACKGWMVVYTTRFKYRLLDDTMSTLLNTQQEKKRQERLWSQCRYDYNMHEYELTHKSFFKEVQTYFFFYILQWKCTNNMSLCVCCCWLADSLSSMNTGWLQDQRNFKTHSSSFSFD